MNVLELWSFLGLITYYRDLWLRQSHILVPLTELMGATWKGIKKKPFIWTEQCERAFKEMKAVAAKDALLHYPDHNLPFDIETDASDYQFGAVIKQNNWPVA